MVVYCLCNVTDCVVKKKDNYNKILRHIHGLRYIFIRGYNISMKIAQQVSSIYLLTYFDNKLVTDSTECVISDNTMFLFSIY